MFRNILAILLTLLFVGIASGQTTFYVDTTGNDSNNGTSQSTPWRTVARVDSALRSSGTRSRAWSPGDSVLFKRGHSWQPTNPAGYLPLIGIAPSRISGTVANPIVFADYGSGAKPILSVENAPAAYINQYNNNTFHVGGNNNNIQIKNLELRGAWRFYTSIDTVGVDHGVHTSGITIDSCFLNGTPLLAKGFPQDGNALQWIFPVYSEAVPVIGDSMMYGHMSNVEIKNCYAENCWRTYHFYNSWENIWVHHNRAYNCRSVFDVAQGRNIVYEYNWSYNDRGIGGAIKTQCQRATIDTLIVRGNLQVTKGAADQMLGYNLPAQTSYGRIYNNTFITESPYVNSFALELGSEQAPTTQNVIQNFKDGTGSIHDTKFYNNILIGGLLFCEHTNLQVTYAGSDSAHYHITETIDSMRAHGLRFENNIIMPDAGNSTYAFADRHWVDLVCLPVGTGFLTTGVDNYIHQLCPASAFDSLMNGRLGTNNWNVDPVFANYDGEDSSDYRLSASSPFREAGIAIPGYTHDLSGYSVPQSGSISIGCFQAAYVTPPAPTVTSSAASGIHSTYVTMNGVVNPNGQSSIAYFEWGESPTLSNFNMTSYQSAGSGASNVPITELLSSLNSNTDYYYRAIAFNSGGIVKGDIVQVTTALTPVSERRRLLIKQ